MGKFVISRRTFIGSGTAALGLAAFPIASSAGASTPWSQLTRSFGGQLVLPSDPFYATAKQLELGNFDAVTPQAIAYCTSASDVSLAVRFAQDNTLPVAVRSGGHNYGGYSTGPGLVIDLSRMNAVTVGDGTVTIGPGAMNVDILNALAPHQLVVSEGGCPTVAAGGFLQGGGFGLLTRSTGMACDAVTSAQVVLADGRTVTASPTSNPDLFWAIRGGGGGNFGIVTRYSVTPHAGDQVLMTNLIFPYDRSPDVLHGVAQWLVDAPRTIGGGAYVVQADASPGTVPAVNVMLASRGTQDELTAEAARLLALTGAPTTRQDAALTYQALEMLIFGCGGLTGDQCRRSEKTTTGVLTRPAYALERSRFGAAPFTAAQWTDVMSAFDAGRHSGQARYLDLHMFGGAANDPARTATAYVHRDSLFAVNYRAFINDPAAVTAENTASAKSWVDGGFATVDPLSNKESYQNWMDAELVDWKQSYYAENYARLAAVKRARDPYGFFRFAQGIGASG
jgi:FAD/FMN-containing dehydrogenase